MTLNDRRRTEPIATSPAPWRRSQRELVAWSLLTRPDYPPRD